MILTTLFTQVALAQTVTDPQNYLGQIDQFVAARDFHQEFIVGDLIETEETECEIEVDQNGQSEFFCSSFEESKEIVEVGSNYAVMSDGMAFVKELYERYDRSAIRYFLREKAHLMAAIAGESLNGDLEYVLTGLTPSNILGSDALRLEMLVTISDNDGYQFAIPMYVLVARDLPFMGQVAEAGLLWEIDGKVLPPSYKVIGFIKN